MLIKACLNGARGKHDHPGVPITPEELAADARRVVDAGAGALHIHPRDGDGAETLEPEAVRAALVAVREACPGIPVGLTTGLWVTGDDPKRRLELVGQWTGDARPDFASVNVSEPGAAPLASQLRATGIGVEAGVWSSTEAEELGTSDWAGDLVRVLVEAEEPDATAALATVAAIERGLDVRAVGAPRLHHGAGAATWPVLRAGLRLGRDVRVGLEDTTVLPDGSTAAGNRELVEAAVALASEAALG
jgi:uncharacterized protein (DUF849 family)